MELSHVSVKKKKKKTFTGTFLCVFFCFVYLLVWCSEWKWKSCKSYENAVKSLIITSSITFSKTVQWAGLESLLGWFRSPGLIFDTPALNDNSKNSKVAALDAHVTQLMEISLNWIKRCNLQFLKTYFHQSRTAALSVLLLETAHLLFFKRFLYNTVLLIIT